MTHLVLPFHRMEEAAPYLDPKRLHYLHEGQSESFESFEDSTLAEITTTPAFSF